MSKTVQTMHSQEEVVEDSLTEVDLHERCGRHVLEDKELHAGVLVLELRQVPEHKVTGGTKGQIRSLVEQKRQTKSLLEQKDKQSLVEKKDKVTGRTQGQTHYTNSVAVAHTQLMYI